MSILLFAAAALSLNPGTEQFREKDTVRIDPTKSYLVIRTNYVSGIRLFRTVSDSERSTWENERRVLYDKARAKYDRALKRYERDTHDWEKGSTADRRMIGKKPVRPKEVTLEGVAIAPVEMANFVTIAGHSPISKDANGMRTFLIALPAGDYRIHGVPAQNEAIGNGNCLCFGSVGFTLSRGQVTDGGMLTGSSENFFEMPVYVPASASPAPIAKLPGVSIVPANVRAVGKFANFYANPVTRLAPVAGVLAYDRDIPLDVANGNAPLKAVR